MSAAAGGKVEEAKSDAKLTITSTISLNDGRAIPAFGLGVWRAEGRSCHDAVLHALKAGYRHIDTATLYGNEEQVGAALRESGVPREQVWITTKIWTDDFGFKKTQKAADQCLKRLGLDYVDLLLLHAPDDDYVDAWRGLCKVHEAGKAKSIGVSNFSGAHIDAVLATGGPVPAVNQIELHPFLTQTKVADYCAAKGIVVTAYAPLVRAKKFGDKTLKAVTAKYAGKTAAQVLIRYALDRGLVVIPKSVNEGRIKENCNVFDFELSAEDVATLNDLDEDHHECWNPLEWDV